MKDEGEGSNGGAFEVSMPAVAKVKWSQTQSYSNLTTSYFAHNRLSSSSDLKVNGLEWTHSLYTSSFQSFLKSLLLGLHMLLFLLTNVKAIKIWLGEEIQRHYSNIKTNMLMIENWENTEKHKEKISTYTQGSIYNYDYIVCTFYTWTL